MARAHAGNFPGSSNSMGTGPVTFKHVSDTTLHGEQEETLSRGYNFGHTATYDKELQDAATFYFKENKKSIESATIPSGHIRKIEYAPEPCIMRVTFQNGSVVLYNEVAPTLAGELLALARNRHTVMKDGIERHLLGIRFWEEIRIHGRRYGSKLPFQYETHGSSKYLNSNKRYYIKLTKEIYKAVVATNPALMSSNIKEGSIIESPLSEEELLKLAEDEKLIKDIQTGKLDGTVDSVRGAGLIGTYDPADIETTQSELGEDSAVQREFNNAGREVYGSNMLDAIADYSSNPEDIVIAKEEEAALAAGKSQNNVYDAQTLNKIKQYSEQLDRFEKLSDEIKNARSAERKKYDDRVENEAIDRFKTAQKNKIDFLGGTLDYDNDSLTKDILKVTGLNDTLTNDLKLRAAKKSRYQGRLDELIGQEKAAEYRRLAATLNKADNARGLMRHVWTPAELEDMAGTQPGAVSPEHRAAYKAILAEARASGDYQPALRFLQTFKGEVYSYDPVFHQMRKIKDYGHYAGKSDILAWL